ncbi:MAG: hypothetical protein ACE5E7_07360 [Anaerolineae bacterium]
MGLNLLHLHGWLLIGVTFTAVIHMLGSSVLFIKVFQCENGQRIYGIIASILAALALGTGVLAQRYVGAMLATAVLLLLAASQLIVLGLPEQTFQHRRFWLATNSSIVALFAFVLAKQVAALIG